MTAGIENLIDANVVARYGSAGTRILHLKNSLHVIDMEYMDLLSVEEAFICRLPGSFQNGHWFDGPSFAFGEV